MKSTAHSRLMNSRIVLAGKHGVDIGVGRAGDLAARAEREPESVEVVSDRLQQHEQAQHDRQVDLGGRNDLLDPVLRLQPDSAEEVVGKRGDEQRHDHDTAKANPSRKRWNG